MNNPPQIWELSPREAETMRLVSKGLSNVAIAERMKIRERSVCNYINCIFAKKQLGYDDKRLNRRVVLSRMQWDEDRNLDRRIEELIQELERIRIRLDSDGPGRIKDGIAA